MGNNEHQNDFTKVKVIDFNLPFTQMIILIWKWSAALVAAWALPAVFLGGILFAMAKAGAFK
ncbi:MAG: hypothetical protein FWG02_10020 [Holophagaceae bacterium]|nr:hypothetical protein [Holophagaceae bacterium]